MKLFNHLNSEQKIVLKLMMLPMEHITPIVKSNLTIPKKIKKYIGNKNIATNICRIQAYESITSRYFCFGFIDFMLNNQNLTDFTNAFSPKKFKNNDKVILNYIMN